MKNRKKNVAETYPLAVVGAACYLPGAASAEEFWSNLFNERISVGVPSADRFDDAFFDSERGKRGRTYSNLAATVDVERFCREIVPKMEAEFAASGRNVRLTRRAPGELIALYVAAEAFRSAGISPTTARKEKTGLFCGLVSVNGTAIRRRPVANLRRFVEELEQTPAFASFSETERAQIKERFFNETEPDDFFSRSERFLSDDGPDGFVDFVRRALRLDGAGFSFDAACSSSLLGFELARNYLESGKLRAALVGGASWYEASGTTHFAKVSAISADGARPFEDDADGMVPGEGCAFCLVKSVEAALEDGDRILGVVRGVGVSSDGRGKGLWAPSEEGQTLSAVRALSDAGVESFEEIDYIEAHATSTRLGDATELSSLTAAAARTNGVSAARKIPVVIVKASIGHVLEAAGTASVLKALASLENETILRQPNFGRPSTKVDWEKTPFFVPTENVRWPRPENAEETAPFRGRSALVDAFGIGGLNCQVVVGGPEFAEAFARRREKTRKTPETPIAVVGVGTVLPGAFSVPALNERLESGRDGLGPIPFERRNLLFEPESALVAALRENGVRGGFIADYEYDWRPRRIPPKQIRLANPLQFAILGAVDEAVASAAEPLRAEKTAVVVGTRSDADFMKVLNIVLNLPLLEARLRRVLAGFSSDAARTEAVVAEFRDYLYANYPVLDDETGGFTISSLASRITKSLDLKGGAVALDGGEIASFVALENAVELLRRRPELDAAICVAGHSSVGADVFEEFWRDGGGRGPVPGEGAVAFLLKRLDDAEAAGDPIRAVLRSVRTSGASGATDDENEARRVAVETVNRVLSEFAAGRSELRGELIFNGAAESGVWSERNFANFETETREIFGDLRPANGAAALARAVCEFEKDGGENGADAAILAQIDRRGAFGALCVERYCRRRGKNREENVSFNVAETENRMNFNENGKENQRENGLNVAKTDAGKLVFLFPGQGSQYPGMLAALLERDAELRETAREFDAVLTRSGAPTFRELTVDGAKSLGKDALRTQLAVLTADSLLAKYFELRGVAPDFALGHSFGEYAALVAAGAWSFETAVWATRRRCAILEKALERLDAQNDGGESATTMLSTNANGSELQKTIDELRENGAVADGTLFVSNRNAPDQTVASGTRPALAVLAAELKKRGVAAVFLPVPAAFHSPLLGAVCEPFRRDVLARVRLNAPQFPILSGVSGAFENEPERLRELLVEQTTRPVEFVAAVEAAFRAGGRTFVEIGSKRVLGRLAARILGDRGDGVRFLFCDSGKGGDPAEFAETVAAATAVRRETSSTETSQVVRISGLELENDAENRVESVENGAEKSRILTRFVDRAVPLPELSSASQVADWSAFPATLVLRFPGNRLAAKIRKRIAERGGRAVSISLFDEDERPVAEDVLRENVRDATRKFRCFNVLILTSFDSDRPFEFAKADCEKLTRTAENVAVALQEWYRFVQSEGALARAQVLAATRMGGALGLAGPLDFPVDGALLGLVRGLKFEARTDPNGGGTFDAFAVDHSADEEPDVVAENLLDELFAEAETRRGRKVDVARRGRRRRYGIRVVEEAAGSDKRAAALKIAQVVENVGETNVADIASKRAVAAASVENGERPVWLATGGARGVTAELALEIGKRFGAKLYLIGSTRLEGDPSWGDLDADGVKNLRARVVKAALEKGEKPTEIWAKTEKNVEIFRNFRRFRDAGVEFEYFAQDLCDYDAAKKLVERLRDNGPKITGVLFGAGFESARIFEKKTVETVRRTIGAKLASAVPILDALQTAAPRFVVGMGSISGRFGSRGQVDYCIANNALGKLLTGFAIRRVDCRSIQFHWYPWADVGMAARPESNFVFRAAGMTPTPISEATEAFFEELSAQNVEREVCFAQREYCRRICAGDAGSSVANDALEETLRTSGALSGALGATVKTVETTETVENAGVAANENAAERFVVGADEYLRRDSVARRVAEIGAEAADASIDRFVVRALETAPPDAWNAAANWREIVDGTVLIVGGETGEKSVAARLESAFRAVGVAVKRPDFSSETDVEATVDRVWNEREIRYVIFLNAEKRDDSWRTERYWDPNGGAYRRELTTPYRICRRLVGLLRENRRFDRIGFATVGRAGGDFGLSRGIGEIGKIARNGGENGGAASPSGGFIAGILKGLRDEICVKERVYLPIKIVDFEENAPNADVAAKTLAEIQSELFAIRDGLTRQTALVEANSTETPNPDWGAFDVEVGWRGGRRFVVRTLRQPLERGDAAPIWRDWTLPANDEKTETPEKRRGAENGSDVWIAVGGLRGVTCATVSELARNDCPRKIYVVGFNPFEPLDPSFLRATEAEIQTLRRETTCRALRERKNPCVEWREFSRRLETTRNFDAFRRLGVEIVYLRCDARRWADVAAAVAQIKANGDRAVGLVFGAGWGGRDASIDAATPEAVDDGLRTKLCGLAAFLETLRDEPLRFVAAFGSVSGRFGGNGQVAYTAQNDATTKILAYWRARRPNCRFVCFEWGAWDDVGMATRPEVRGALVAAKTIFLSAKQGAKFFADEFAAGAPEPEVLFCPWKYYQRFQPDGKSLPKGVLRKIGEIGENGEDEIAGKIAAEPPGAPEIDLDAELEIAAKTRFDGGFAVFGKNADARALRRKIARRTGTGGDAEADSAAKTVRVLITTPRDAATAKVDDASRLDERRAVVRDVLRRVDELRDAETFEIVVLGRETPENPLNFDEAELLRGELERFGTEKTRVRVAVRRFPDDAIPERVADALWSEFCETEGERLKTSEFIAKRAEFAEKSEFVAKTLKTSEKSAFVAKKAALPTGETRRLDVVVDPTRDRFLLEHRIQGRPILPFVVGLELFYRLALQTGRFGESGGRFELRDVKAINGLICASPAPRRLTLEANAAPDGRSVSMRLVDRKSGANGRVRPFFSATAGAVETNDSTDWASWEDWANRRGAAAGTLGELRGARTWTPEYPGPDSNGFYHGPALQRLRKCFFVGENEIVGEIRVPNRKELVETAAVEAKSDENWRNNAGTESCENAASGGDSRIWAENADGERTTAIDAAVLDACFWTCGVLNGLENPGAAIIPEGLGRLRGRLGALNEGAICRVRARRVREERLPFGYKRIVFDFDAFDENERLVYSANEFRTTELRGAAAR